MKTIIYLDLDDTLADTTRNAIEKFKVKNFTLTRKRSVLNNLFSILKVWNGIKNNHSFWEGIPLKQDAKIIYEKALAINADIHVLTALPVLFFKKNTLRFSLAAQAKKNWVRKNFPNIPDENIHVVYAREKHLKVNDPSIRFILVDDSRKNIARWIKVGGIGIFVDPISTTHLSLLDKYSA